MILKFSGSVKYGMIYLLYQNVCFYVIGLDARRLHGKCIITNLGKGFIITFTLVYWVDLLDVKISGLQL